MAQYILIPPTHADSTPALPEKDNPTLIPSKDLFAPGIIHTFLIRTPEKAVPSYYKLCTGENCAITGFDYFDPEEVGISDLRILYEFVTSKTGRKPLLIDSADLLEKPEAYMEAYCRHCQVEWDPNMLNWSSGTQEHVRPFFPFSFSLFLLCLNGLRYISSSGGLDFMSTRRTRLGFGSRLHRQRTNRKPGPR